MGSCRRLFGPRYGSVHLLLNEAKNPSLDLPDVSICRYCELGRAAGDLNHSKQPDDGIKLVLGYFFFAEAIIEALS